MVSSAQLGLCRCGRACQDRAGNGTTTTADGLTATSRTKNQPDGARQGRFGTGRQKGRIAESLCLTYRATSRLYYAGQEPFRAPGQPITPWLTTSTKGLPPERTALTPLKG